MKALIQRVTSASVKVDEKIIGQIDTGLLVLLGIDREDNLTKLEKLVHKVSNYRVFCDNGGKMNLSLKDIQGGLLVVSQFTLSGDTKKGMRPSFSSAAPPDMGEKYYQKFIELARESIGKVESGQFGADMQVSLVNDGPVTFLLEA